MVSTSVRRTAVVPTVDAASSDRVDGAVRAIAEHGAVVVEGLLLADETASLQCEIDRLVADGTATPGSTSFAGHATLRVSNLVPHPTFHRLLIDSRIVAIAEAVLGPDPLLSGSSAARVLPGQAAQTLHTDDGLITLPRPHPTLVLMVLWALTPFTRTNGATRIVPGSHRAASTPRSGTRTRTWSLDVPAGGALLFDGSLWHGAGACEQGERDSVAVQYVAGWCRPQDNLLTGSTAPIIDDLPRPLADLIGRRAYRGTIGTIDGADHRSVGYGGPGPVRQ